MLAKETIVDFIRTKSFKYVKQLGSGGTGDVHLFRDETTDMLFAIKKYSPKDKKYKDEYYKRFVDEMKILFQLSHPNVVRIYNYYLYPNVKVGYLQMEYVEGTPINQYDFKMQEGLIDKIFFDLIEVFRYLESKNILHRDIRTSNLMVNIYGSLKVIDFGFGKILQSDEIDNNSIILNWPVSEQPEEITNHIYNHQTEIFFLGKLLQKIIIENSLIFKFEHILRKMVKVSINERYKSFDEISNDISIGGFVANNEFSDDEKIIYRKFADGLISNIMFFLDEYKPVNDVNIILKKLRYLIKCSSLETNVQNNSLLLTIFTSNRLRSYDKRDMLVSDVVNFYNFFEKLDYGKQKIVLRNIQARLSTIEVIIKDDLPF